MTFLAMLRATFADLDAQAFETEEGSILTLNPTQTADILGGMPVPDQNQDENNGVEDDEGDEPAARPGADGGSDEDAGSGDTCAIDAGGATDEFDADPFGADLAGGIDFGSLDPGV